VSPEVFLALPPEVLALHVDRTLRIKKRFKL
jgi:hypothetical protein